MRTVQVNRAHGEGERTYLVLSTPPSGCASRPPHPALCGGWKRLLLSVEPRAVHPHVRRRGR